MPTPQDVNPTQVDWQISTQGTSDTGDYVEAGPLTDGSGRVAMRHSRYPDGPVIVYTPEEWEAFIGGVKDGEFDFE